MTNDTPADVSGQHQRNRLTALQHAEAGLRIFPARIFQNALEEWKKRPLIKDWQSLATTDPAQIQQWFDQFPDAVPAIALQQTGIVVIDLDRHDNNSDGIAAMKRLTEQYGELPSCPIIETPGDGLHLYFKQPTLDEPIGNSAGDLPPGIDVRGARAFIIAPGAIRPDGEEYLELGGPSDLIQAFVGGTIPEVPSWLHDIIKRKKPSPASEIDPKAAQMGEASLREQAYVTVALGRCIEEVGHAPRGTRNTVLNSVSFRLGRMIGRGWIDRSDAEAQLIEAAETCGLVREDGREAVRASIRSGLDAGMRSPHEDLPDRAPLTLDAEGRVDKSAAASEEDLGPVVRWDGDPAPHPQKWLVRGLIPQHSVGLVVGESQAGKSFVMVDLAVRLATDTYFFTKPARRGGTAYVAAEAADTIQERIDAAREGYKNDPSGSLQEDGLTRLPIAIIENVPDLARPEGCDLLIEKINAAAVEMEKRFGVRLQLVIIDTMLAGMGVDEWNSAGETSKAMRALRRIGQGTGTTVIGVHHHGKDRSRGATGSFALTAASDFIISVLRKVDESGIVERRWIALTKSRRGETGWKCPFHLEGVQLGVDEEGADLWCAYVKPSVETAGFGGDPVKAQPKESKGVHALRNALSEALSTSGQPVSLEDGSEVEAVLEGSLRETFAKHYVVTSDTPEKKAEAIRRAFTRALTDAMAAWLDRGHVDGADWVWFRKGSG